MVMGGWWILIPATEVLHFANVSLQIKVCTFLSPLWAFLTPNTIGEIFFFLAVLHLLCVTQFSKMPKALTFWNCFQYHLPLYDIGQDSIGLCFKTFRKRCNKLISFRRSLARYRRWFRSSVITGDFYRAWIIFANFYKIPADQAWWINKTWKLKTVCIIYSQDIEEHRNWQYRNHVTFNC